MFNNKNKFILLLSVSAITSSILVGSAVYTIKGTSIEGKVEIGNNETGVAYIQGEEDTLYTTIEGALAVANSLASSNSPKTVYVVPGTNPTISTQCYVGNNVTLTFPYEGTTYETASDDSGDLPGFADNNPETYRKNSVLVKTLYNDNNEVIPTITIDEGGKINVGGRRRSISPQGCTSGNYVELVLEENARIDNYGDIYCMGYIKEDADNNGSIINIFNTGNITQPLVVYDWSATRYISAGITAKVFPFNYFDFPQVSPTLVFYGNASLEASAWMYGDSAGDMFASAYILGSETNSALITQNSNDSNNKIIWKNIDTNAGTSISTSKTSHKISIQTYGNYSLKYFELNVKGYEINSQDYFLPFSNFFTIEIQEGTFNIDEDVKLMPGAKVINHKGATININADIFIHN